MAWPAKEHFISLLTHAKEILDEVQIIRHDINTSRALLDFEGTWHRSRVIVSEIHRPNPFTFPKQQSSAPHTPSPSEKSSLPKVYSYRDQR